MKGGVPLFPSLNAEIARQNIKTKDIATALNLTEKSVRNKIIGKYDFTYSEMKAIRDKFFPQLTIDYLFYENNLTA